MTGCKTFFCMEPKKNAADELFKRSTKQVQELQKVHKQHARTKARAEFWSRTRK